MERYPDAKFIAHTQCRGPYLRKADFIGSTSQLLKYTKENAASTFIVATESGILHQMELASPAKTFIPAPPNNTCYMQRLSAHETQYPLRSYTWPLNTNCLKSNWKSG